MILPPPPNASNGIDSIDPTAWVKVAMVGEDVAQPEEALVVVFVGSDPAPQVVA